MLSYGEAHTKRKLSMTMDKGVWKAIDLPYHKPQMNKQDAGVYYTNKINKYFGIEEKVKKEFNIQEEYNEEFLYHFDSVEDEFDYWEAKRLLDTLRSA